MSLEEVAELRTAYVVKLPHQRLRFYARKLQSLHRSPPPLPAPADPVTVVCISDTHGTQPLLPEGDLLIHAGDLTEWGTFRELQAQLTWLAQQPHKHKVVIAGNHDLLLDPLFQQDHPEKWKQAHDSASASKDDRPKVADSLQWGDIVYLQNTSTSIAFGNEGRTINIFGSPLTPQYGLSAFQYPGGNDVWNRFVPSNTDILLTHGPPWGHLDSRGIRKSGCPSLAKEVARVRPKLVVFGHIHVGYGQEERVYDRVGRAHEAILGAWGGWKDLIDIAVSVLLGRTIPQRWRRTHRSTTFVNAAVVEGYKEHKIKNEAVVITI